MLELGLKFTIAYLLGSVLGSLVVGYLKGGVDIRSVGSGNAGGTNALRTQGVMFAFFVLLIDVGKGVAAVYLIPPMTLPAGAEDAELSRSLILYATAFGVIVGHVFPIWFDFKGGKGGATAAGVLFVIAPPAAPVIIAVWALIAYFTGFVGLATISASTAAAVFFAATRLPEQHGLVLFAASVAALIAYTHRSNIRRMLDGTESRFGRHGGDRSA